MTTAVHGEIAVNDSVEDYDDYETNHMDDTNTKNQQDQPLFITEHNIVQYSLHHVFYIHLSSYSFPWTAI